MRICALIKYPPIQGGVSAQGYWLARGLAERGHQVDVVTNSMEVEAEYRLRLTEEDREWLTARFDNGGRVRLHTPEIFSPKLSHIPSANPFVSKLAGLATRVIREHDSQVIFSYYLEPNGVAANLASAWTGKPYIVQHAGSDLGRLMKQPGLDSAYIEVFRRAQGICTGSPYTFLGMGVAEDCIYSHPPFFLPKRYFSPEAEPLDLNAHIAAVEALVPGVIQSPGVLDPDLPTVGIYGKLGEVKGSFDLLQSLARLRKEGKAFNFVAVTSGRDRARYLQALRDLDLERVSWILPFMAHWRIARFLRACDAVCFLERDFPITFHAPTIPREVLACGTCLILSGEILAKQPYRELMEDGRNFLLVEDPKDHDALSAALRRVIDDPAAAREIGQRGYEARAQSPDHDVQAESYERMFEDVIARASGEPSRVAAADRGLAATRRETLRRLSGPLLEALGETADTALDRHIGEWPHPRSPLEDARELCAAWMHPAESRAVNQEVREAATFARHLLWLGAFEGEEAEPRFDRDDVLPERSAGKWNPALIRTLAPVATRWLRIVRLEHWRPPGSVGSSGETVVIFHKLPSLTGHHFGVNRFTAELLESCDGRRSVDQLIRHYVSSTGREPREVGKVLADSFRRFYREGLIVFADPSGE